jgi:hypothetical protein
MTPHTGDSVPPQCTSRGRCPRSVQQPKLGNYGVTFDSLETAMIPYGWLAERRAKNVVPPCRVVVTGTVTQRAKRSGRADELSEPATKASRSRDLEDGGPTIPLPAAEFAAPSLSVSYDWSIHGHVSSRPSNPGVRARLQQRSDTTSARRMSSFRACMPMSCTSCAGAPLVPRPPLEGHNR